jgi:hypothetical protein
MKPTQSPNTQSKLTEKQFNEMADQAFEVTAKESNFEAFKSQSKEAWEQEFNDLFLTMIRIGNIEFDQSNIAVIRNFIRTIISSTRQQVQEEMMADLKKVLQEQFTPDLEEAIFEELSLLKETTK